ncbi:hypothetical protein Esi_0055_0003 [Ectocarpus siliculosus]|uniref:RING-type domain-containing protein n=1 Tax=Ectocarpus siliculosus TaxID=2880 RepID=D7G455_ECTSI|nr:hypothetical protein Esi_0055_0003 [Ectocarpus siliculosus]|eukprot:CBJ27070.1 hypothetical protein Esi_0055_0003 [Ectocarpus siliculosus]
MQDDDNMQAGVVRENGQTFDDVDRVNDAGRDDLCVICLDPLATRRRSSLRCRRVFHKDCIERLCRQNRRRKDDPPGAWICCPMCRQPTIIGEIRGFESVIVWPVPRRIVSGQSYASIDLYAFLERRNDRRTRATHVLVTLAEDILGFLMPPFSVPPGWSEYVEHVRRLPRREVDDTVWLPILCREEGARDVLVAWGREVHRPERGGRYPPFPWPLQPTSRPRPRRMLRQTETMEEYVNRRAREGHNHYDVLVDLRADVLRERRPPYVPPQGWSGCVNAHRVVSENVRSSLYEEVQFTVLRVCGRYEGIREWASAVRFWARRVEQGEEVGGFPVFPSADNGNVSPHVSEERRYEEERDVVVAVVGEVATAGASAEVQRAAGRALERGNRQLQDSTVGRRGNGAAFEDSARECLEDYVRRVTRAGSAPNTIQHLVDDIIHNASPPFIAGAFWDDFVATRRRHVNARRQYQRFPFGDEPEDAALGDFRDRIEHWAEVHERRSRRDCRSMLLPTFPWSLSVESPGIWDCTRHVERTNAVSVADFARPNDDGPFPPPCTQPGSLRHVISSAARVARRGHAGGETRRRKHGRD